MTYQTEISTFATLALLGLVTACAVEDMPATDGSNGLAITQQADGNVEEVTDSEGTFCSASSAGQTLCNLDLAVADNAPVGLQFDLNYDVSALQLKGFSCEKDGVDPCSSGTIAAGHHLKYAQNDNGARVLVVSFDSVAPVLSESGTLLSAVFEGQGGEVTLSGVVVSDATGQAMAAQWQDGILSVQ